MEGRAYGQSWFAEVVVDEDVVSSERFAAERMRTMVWIEILRDNAAACPAGSVPLIFIRPPPPLRPRRTRLSLLVP